MLLLWVGMGIIMFVWLVDIHIFTHMYINFFGWARFQLDACMHAYMRVVGWAWGICNLISISQRGEKASVMRWVYVSGILHRMDGGVIE